MTIVTRGNTCKSSTHTDQTDREGKILVDGFIHCVRLQHVVKVFVIAFFGSELISLNDYN